MDRRSEAWCAMQGAQVPLDYITITAAVDADPNQAAGPGVATVAGRRLQAHSLRHALLHHAFVPWQSQAGLVVARLLRPLAWGMSGLEEELIRLMLPASSMPASQQQLPHKLPITRGCRHQHWPLKHRPSLPSPCGSCSATCKLPACCMQGCA